MSAKHTMTVARKAALKKAQVASAIKRRKKIFSGSQNKVMKIFREHVGMKSARTERKIKILRSTMERAVSGTSFKRKK